MEKGKLSFVIFLVLWGILLLCWVVTGILKHLYDQWTFWVWVTICALFIINNAAKIAKYDKRYHD